MSDAYFARLSALRDRLARADVDGLLVSSLPNIRYLTGFSGSNALLIITPRECVLFTDFRYATHQYRSVDYHENHRRLPS